MMDPESMKGMSPQEFLEHYFVLKQQHERKWEETWQEKLRPFFGEYFLELRSQEDSNWAVLPKVIQTITEDDDTVSFISEADGHHTKRYYVSQNQGKYTIERIMIQCSLCGGAGQVLQGDSESTVLEPCPLCDGRGWDDWLD